MIDEIDEDEEESVAGDANLLAELIRVRKDELLVPWTIMTTAIGMIALVASLVTNDKYPAELPRYVVPLFWLPALAGAALSVLLPLRQLRTKHIVEHMARAPEPRKLAKNLRTGEASDDMVVQLMLLSPEQQRMFGLLALTWKPMLIGLSLSVGVAVVGCVLSIVARNFLTGFPMMVVALALNGFHFPRLAQLQARGKKHVKDEELDEFTDNLRQMERKLKIKQRKRPTRPTPGP